MVSAEKLKKNYGGFELDVSFEIPDGRVVGLVGKNGAGKSTVIKSILGLIKPDSGLVNVFGKNARGLNAADKQRIGTALPESGFSDELNILSISKILDKMYGGFSKDEFLEKCRLQGLPEKKKTGEFSTGMKAKLKVLTAITHGAELLILDEPTAGLDVEARIEVLDILREYLRSDEKRSILITSHIATDLESICDEIYLIHNGKIIVHEDTDVILSDCGVIKLNAQDFESVDRSHIRGIKEEAFGYSCFTDDLRYYQNLYPGIITEKAGIDDLIIYLTGGQ